MGTKTREKQGPSAERKKAKVTIRKARVSDAKAIQTLVNDFARRHEMIPRSLNEIYENLRDFTVCEVEGTVAGVCALHVLWEDLAEVRSLAVGRDFQGRGIGRSLVRRALREARGLGVKRVFALTYVVDFFRPFGFRDYDKQRLPQKIWGECVKCAKFPECDELAVIKEL